MPRSPHDFPRPLLLLALTVLLALSWGCTARKDSVPLARHGVFDLAAAHNLESQPVRLDGRWEFYWKKLLTPADFQDPHPPLPSAYISLPGTWNTTRVEGKKFSPFGYATLRLKILPGVQKRQVVLRLDNVHSAYKLWVNGTMVTQGGRIGRDRSEETMSRLTRDIRLTMDGRPIELVLQISNYHYGRGGVATSILLGPEKTIQSAQRKKLAQILFCIGLVVIMGLYHLVLFCLRRKDRAPLYFSLYCLLWAGYLLTANQYDWVIFLFINKSWLSYALLNRVQMLCFTLSLPFVLSFLRALYPMEFHRSVERFVWGVALVFAAMALVLPITTTSIAIPKYYFIFRGLVIAYNQIMLVVAMRRKREGAVFLVIGYVVFILFGINDMLYGANLIRSVYLAHIGLFVFILFQALALSAKFSQAFTTVERLSNEQKEHISALSRMDRLKDEFLATTSHELRTPLNGIIGLTESLACGVAGPLNKQVRDNLAMISASGRRLHNLVNDILDFSRLKYKDIRLHLQTVDLRAVVDTVLAVSEPLAGDKQLVLHNKVSLELPHVAADEDRLQQILFNLVGNAVKFTDQGEVSVSALACDHAVEIAVQDTGIGIPADKLETIFDAFAQVDGSATRNYGGVGLGLGISRHLVELHGGRLWAESTPGAGSAFRFTLPFSKETVSPPPSAPPPGKAVPQPVVSAVSPQPEPPAPGTPHILAVDDDPINLQVVRNHLGLDKMAVTVATSGPQALALIEQGTVFDLVLLDVMMPGMTGLEVCRRLRHRYNAAELPVIMLTAKNKLADLTEGLECGANDYLRKPFAGEELLARVRTQLKVRKAHELAQENRKLQREVELRAQNELELRLTQQRLAGMLHAVPDSIVAVNRDREIAFCNQAFEKQFGYGVQDLLGRPVDTFLTASSLETLDKWLTGAASGSLPAGGACLELVAADGFSRSSNVIPAALEIDDEHLLMLLVGTIQETASSRLWIDELSRNRKRLQQLEEALNGLTPQTLARHPGFIDDLHAVDRSLEKIGRELSSSLAGERQRALIVETMCLAVDLWTESTQTSKVDLAQCSGLWTVYVNKDGYERTQTLDRYLAIDTLPENPRLKNVFATGEFVLASVLDDTSLRGKLATNLEHLRALRHG